MFFAISAIAWEVDQPDNPTAHDAAKRSLLSLGPDQGAQSLIEDTREIEGLDAAIDGQGLALLATVGKLNQAINDLGVKVGEMESSVVLSSDILFDFDKADIKPTSSRQRRPNSQNWD